MKNNLSFICSGGCGVCTPVLKDFVTLQEELEDGTWRVLRYEPDIVSNCCGSPIEVWDERKEEVCGTVYVR